jgi:hypothetical protein
MGPPASEEANAKESLDRAKKLIDDLDSKGYSVTEAKSWYDQADEMFRGGLYRTSLIYSGYAYDAASEVLERMKSMLVKIAKVKTRANEMLGKDHKEMPKIEEYIEEMKKAVNEGRLDDCQELINAAETIMRGGSSPYLATETVGVTTVAPSRGFMSCPSCGNIVETSWVKCQYCDANLQEEETAPSGPQWAAGVTGPLRLSDTSDRGFPDEEGPKPKKALPPPPPIPKAEAKPEPEETKVDKEMSDDLAELEKVEEDMAKMEEEMAKEETPEEKPAIRIPPPPPPIGDIEEKPEEKEEGKPPPAEGLCPSCGEEIDDDFVKCPVCKTPLK